MRFNTLEAWLRWQESLHPAEIELGLERVAEVVARLLPEGHGFAVITVGGTNGKGSSVAMLESILRHGGYRTGAYTSPHIHRYNERIRLDGVEASDEALCRAFERVDAARGQTPLTYFEFGTLAALALFAEAEVELAILEVGLGGRLDAVNVLDADVALVTTVDVDHTQWLGPDRESIAREKAGIFRPGRAAVYGDREPPASLLAHAEALGSQLCCLGRDYDYTVTDQGWSWRQDGRERHTLPLPALRGEVQVKNAAAVLSVLAGLEARFPLSQDAIRRGLHDVRLAGRFQVIPGEVPVIHDVAHNPQAAQVLAENLAHWPGGAVHAVVAMLADKAMAEVLAALAPEVAHWYLAPLAVPRGASLEQLQAAAEEAGLPAAQRSTYASVREARAVAQARALPGERVLVFGSFFTVAQSLDDTV